MHNCPGCEIGIQIAHSSELLPRWLARPALGLGEGWGGMQQNLCTCPNGDGWPLRTRGVCARRRKPSILTLDRKRWLVTRGKVGGEQTQCWRYASMGDHVRSLRVFSLEIRPTCMSEVIEPACSEGLSAASELNDRGTMLPEGMSCRRIMSKNDGTRFRTIKHQASVRPCDARWSWQDGPGHIHVARWVWGPRG